MDCHRWAATATSRLLDTSPFLNTVSRMYCVSSKSLEASRQMRPGIQCVPLPSAWPSPASHRLHPSLRVVQWISESLAAHLRYSGRLCKGVFYR